MATDAPSEIKEIEIECDIPYDLPDYTCIEYPGKINNINNAIETLGGNVKIQQTFEQFNEFQLSDKQKKKQKKSAMNTPIPKEPYLELHLNPNGVFDHALFGKIRPIKNCILIKKTSKIPKKRKKKRTFDEITNNKNTKVEVIGRISSLVTYDELCDFQVFSDLKYPKKIINDSKNVNDNNNNKLNIIRQTNKRRRIWSLAEDDIPNISKYPLIPQVFASKAVPYDDILKKPSEKTNKSSPNKQSLETKPTEIMFKRKQVPKQPKKGSQWMKWLKDLKEYIKDKNNKKIPKTDKEIKDKLSENEKISFCRKIRNELVIQIKGYFEEKRIWSKTEILLQKFYVYWYYIKYFADRIEITHPNDSNKNVKISENDMFYDFDIANIVFDRKQKMVSFNSNQNIQKKRDDNNHNNHNMYDTHDSSLQNDDKIYLDFKEKDKIISKFLGIVGYKFKSGPFRNSYIKFGFDPRDYSNKHIARPLQIIDYRINKTNGKKLGIMSKWSGGRVGTRGKPNEKKANISAYQHIKLIMNSNEELNEELNEGYNNNNMEENEKLEREIMDRLCFKRKPNKLQTYYQLKNIDINEIGMIIYNEDKKSFNDECLKDCGWILKKDEGKIRELMNQRLDSWIEEEKNRRKREKLLEKFTSKRKEIVEDENVDDGEMVEDMYMDGSVSGSDNVNENEEEKMMELDEEMQLMFDGQLDDGDRFELL